MNKWSGFYALEGTQDEMEKTYESREDVKRRYVSQDQMSEIEEAILRSFNDKCQLEIEYYSNNRYNYVKGVVKKVDIMSKTIRVESRVLNIIDIYSASII